MNILIDAPLPDESAEQIRRLSPDVLLLRPASGQALPSDLLQRADVVYTEQANFDPADAPRLRWVQTNSAAINWIVGKPVMRSPIPIANVSGAYSVAVAECAMGLLLALTRHIGMGVRAQTQRHWPTDYMPWAGDDLYGKTIGIVGYGSIGRHVGRLAEAFGMTVLACKRRPEQKKDDSYLLPGSGDPEGRIPREWFGVDRVGAMFRQSDVAMLALPHTPATAGVIGAAELAALPPHAYLVNVGRGAVLDEAALAQALQHGRLAGAGLDVFCQEPLPPESPFWSLPNVVMLPHIGSWTKVQPNRAAGVLLENVRRDLRGEPLLNLIDKDLLY